MQHRDFCYWLRGYLELSKAETLTKEQVQEINRHLDLVFNNVQVGQILQDVKPYDQYIVGQTPIDTTMIPPIDYGIIWNQSVASC